jgi:hypothetical protein
MRFKRRRNPPKRQFGSKSCLEMKSRQKAITRGFNGGYEIISRSITFGSPIANSYAQSGSVTSEQEKLIMTSIQPSLHVAVRKSQSGIV